MQAYSATYSLLPLRRVRGCDRGHTSTHSTRRQRSARCAAFLNRTAASIVGGVVASICVGLSDPAWSISSEEVVSIPRSTVEQLLLRDYARTVHNMDSKALIGEIDALTRKGKVGSESPPPTTTNRSEQPARAARQQGEPELESSDLSNLRSGSTFTSPEMFTRAQGDLLRQQRVKDQEDLRQPRLKDLQLPSRPSPSTQAADDSPKPSRTTPSVTSSFFEPTQSEDQTAELLGLRAQGGSPSSSVEKSPPDNSRVKDAAMGIAGLPLALWQSLDRLFPESIQPAAGNARTEELQRAVLVTKTFIVVSAAVAIAALARRLALAAVESLQRLVLIQHAVAVWRSVQQAGQTMIDKARATFAPSEPKDGVQPLESVDRAASGGATSTTDVLDAVSGPLPSTHTSAGERNRGRTGDREVAAGMPRSAGEDMRYGGPGQWPPAGVPQSGMHADALAPWPVQPPRPTVPSAARSSQPQGVQKGDAGVVSSPGPWLSEPPQPGTQSGNNQLRGDPKGDGRAVDAAWPWSLEPPPPLKQNGSSQLRGGGAFLRSGGDRVADLGGGVLWKKQAGSSDGFKAAANGGESMAKSKNATVQDSGVLWRKQGLSSGERASSWASRQVQEQEGSEGGSAATSTSSAQQASERGDKGDGAPMASASKVQQRSQETDRDPAHRIAALHASLLSVEETKSANVRNGNG